jgi:ferredoxin
MPKVHYKHFAPSAQIPWHFCSLLGQAIIVLKTIIKQSINEANLKASLMPEKAKASFDIFNLLSENEQKTKEEPKQTSQREELLAATKVKDLFPQGTITINKYTCVGVQCKLCIKACPTNALYWTTNGIGIIEDLCVHCQACVLSCMVDDCIKITRKREDNKEERFAKPHDVVTLNDKTSAKKRLLRVKDVFPTWEDYCKRYTPSE